MGKYQTTVASSATSLYELDGEAGANLIAGLAFGHKHPHIPEILTSMYEGLAVRIHQAYKYGRDTYTHGLPNGFKELIGDPPVADIEDAISAELGYPVQVHYASLSEADDEYMAEKYAWENWGWKYGDQFMYDPPLAPEKGSNVTIHSTVFNPYNNLIVTLKIGETGTVGNPIPVLRDVLVKKEDLNPVPDQSKLYYHVRYTPVGATTPNHAYWVYEVGSGNPILDQITYEDLESPFLPIIPLRENNKNLGPESADGEFIKDQDGNFIRPDTDLYRTSRRLCKFLDTDFDDLTCQITGNPDIKDVDHAYLIFGIDIRTESRDGQAYLFDYFEDLSVKASGNQSIVIQDANFKVRLTYNDNVRSFVTGELGQPYEFIYSGDNLTMRRDEGDGTYTQLVITNLVHTNYVYRSHAVKTSLSDSADSENFNFIVPLSYDIFNNHKGLLGRQNLIKEAFKIVFNSYERRKLKWYERGIFKAILLVIAIVVTVYTAGTAASGISAAYAAGGISAAISAAATMIFTAIAIGTAVKWFASQLPPELGIVVALVLTAISLSSTTGTTDFALADSETLLGMTGSIFEGIQQGIQDDIEALMDEMNKFMEEAQAAQDELDELWNELDVSQDWFDQLVAEATQPIIIETPTEFYTRTIHAGNIGTATLSQIENYVDKALELPELTQI
ncbi:hypothetical protein VPMG_00081 [Vibrio phage VBP32]|uniref:TMhelix containing protein n=2 Tax=Stoningtonvirus VBP47 TaxID=2846606 RepID=M4SL50_9CAUD|nr:hypothetical protein VPNG_00048 [Vibrio phage VBP47]YP_007676571.1 hypothetical protein VPMG_00081 [Vibrio phage VBP32]AGH57072.1 hypothetical protein VPNG_00048 [Vibrio phage VBP47]AGH57220.1 hypothetical protein VPMG_00081 [Vibrio phage VBP32]